MSDALRPKIYLGLLLIGLFVSISFHPGLRNFFQVRVLPAKTVQGRIEEHRSAEDRLKTAFTQVQVSYPPKSVTLLFLKDKKTLQLYAGDEKAKLKMIKSYKVLAASGKPGPKLRQGDYQVPEGIYKITYLNPNSSYHLSLRLNYPNEFDREMAKKDKRSNLGGDIMIHGRNVSVGCIAIGDPGIEEVFFLANKVDYRKWTVISAPTDLRVQARTFVTSAPPWMTQLDLQIKSELELLPR